MATGIVKWFDDDRGYGFLSNDAEGAADVFVHYSGIAGEGRRTLVERQRVRFEITSGAKGPQAENVVVLLD